MDDEGNPSQRNVLIEDGILKGYIQDLSSERPPDGRGPHGQWPPRKLRTSHAAHDQHLHAGGDKDPQEIIASIKKGCTPATLVAGRWTSPRASSCFRPAKPTGWKRQDPGPVKGATIMGAAALNRLGKKVTMIGKRHAPDSGVGTCGKEGQSAVGAGQPTFAHRRLYRGGTA